MRGFQPFVWPSLRWGVVFSMACWAVPAHAQLGQPTGITVQQPVVSFFGVNTAVSIPDGGTISLGGISNSAFGSTRRGLPLTGAPYFNRAFGNRAIGLEQGASSAQLSVKVLIMEELEAEVVAKGQQRMAAREAIVKNPNGSAETQKKADFISRNIGTKKRD
jgi:hypothetical protein